MSLALVLEPTHARRERRDRLELLTALIDGPAFDPMLRPDVIDIPMNHPVFRWNCLVEGCDAHTSSERRLCRSHADRWNSQTGVTLGEFIRTAGPIHHRLRLGPTPGCRVPACQRPAQRGIPIELCYFHLNHWLAAAGTARADDAALFRSWLADQPACESFGQCAAVCCAELARSPLMLCEDHQKRYRTDGRPGGASVPANWARWTHATAPACRPATTTERRSTAGAPLSTRCDERAGSACGASRRC